jgi:hypothetical protein
MLHYCEGHGAHDVLRLDIRWLAKDVAHICLMEGKPETMVKLS